MSDTKLFTRKEIEKRNTSTDVVFVIDNLVYDVTKFLDDHPGGHEVLINAAGRDASEDFDNVGHSTDAKKMMKKYCIGEVVDEDKVEVNKRSFDWQSASKNSNSNSFLASWKFPALLGVVVTVLYTYLFV